MEKVGRFELYTLDEVTDELLGPKGTPERDEFDAEVEADLNAYFIGEAMKKVRLEKKLTQEELGKKVGVNRSQISNLEHGRNIAISTMGRIAKALGIQSPTLDLGLVGKFAL